MVEPSTMPDTFELAAQIVEARVGCQDDATVELLTAIARDIRDRAIDD